MTTCGRSVAIFGAVAVLCGCATSTDTAPSDVADTWRETDGVEVVGELHGLAAEETATLRTNFNADDPSSIVFHAFDPEATGKFAESELAFVWDDRNAYERLIDTDPRWFDVETTRGGAGDEDFPESDRRRLYAASVASVLERLEEDIGSFGFAADIAATEKRRLRLPLPTGFPYGQVGDALGPTVFTTAEQSGAPVTVGLADGALVSLDYDLNGEVRYTFRFNAIDADLMPELPDAEDVGTYEDFSGEPPPDE